MLNTILKFLAFVIVLNFLRYVIAAPLSMIIGILGPVFNAMDNSSSYFNTQFTTFDWVTSFIYNFGMWLTATWVFFIMEKRLSGNHILKSLKVYGLMYLFFISVSAIYMNHYSHPKDFYIFNMLDAIIAYGVVAVANGLLFPYFFKERVNN